MINYIRWFIEDILRIPKKVKWFIQRGKRGYADCDLWSLDAYLSSWMPQALRKLSRDSCGCPSEIFDKKAKGDNQCHKWKEILEEMAHAFEIEGKLCYLWDDENDKPIYRNSEEIATAQMEAEKGLQLFARYFGCLWD